MALRNRPRLSEYDPTPPEKDNQLELFDQVAPDYDRRSIIYSLGLNSYWHREALRSLREYPHDEILDVGTGTGTFAVVAQEVLQPQRITGVDISQAMLDLAHDKISGLGLQEQIVLQEEDCARMSFEDNRFDAVIGSYVLRNCEELKQSMREVLRVLKPGGICLFIELTYPEQQPMKGLHALYTQYGIPLLDRWFDVYNEEDDYLSASIYTFPQGREMMLLMQECGFERIRLRRFTLGVVTVYIAEKPKEIPKKEAEKRRKKGLFGWFRK